MDFSKTFLCERCTFLKNVFFYSYTNEKYATDTIATLAISTKTFL